MTVSQNKKTTVAGIVGIISSIVFFIHGYNLPNEHLLNLTLLLTSLLSLLLIFARDPKKYKYINKEEL